MAFACEGGRFPESGLAAVQRRREFPSRVVQTLQVTAHNGLAKIFERPGAAKAPLPMKVAVRMPVVRRVMGRITRQQVGVFA